MTVETVIKNYSSGIHDNSDSTDRRDNNENSENCVINDTSDNSDSNYRIDNNDSSGITYSKYFFSTRNIVPGDPGLARPNVANVYFVPEPEKMLSLGPGPA